MCNILDATGTLDVAIMDANMDMVAMAMTMTLIALSSALTIVRPQASLAVGAMQRGNASMECKLVQIKQRRKKLF